MRALPFLAALLVVAASLAAAGAPASQRMLPRAEGPDVPPATAPVAVVPAFERDLWSFTEGHRVRSVAVPDVDYDRVVLRFVVDHETDPWDRLFGVSLGGADVLRGTTPRADFAVTKDVTTYAALLPPGGSVDVGVQLGTWVGKMFVTVELAFYDDEPTAALVERPYAKVHAPMLFRSIGGGDGSVERAEVDFGPEAPARAVVELTTTGHGPGGEFWYLHGDHLPPTFRVHVDGVEVAHATAMPYVYALVGFGRGSVVGDHVNTVQWWSAHQALDVAGVHTGVAEIPPYRAELPADALPLLLGAKEVRVEQDGGLGYWVTSLSVLTE